MSRIKLNLWSGGEKFGMKIKDALVRQTETDRVEIGEIVRRVYNGKFGEILRAYINGSVTKELTYNQVNPNDRSPLSADRILGRCEAYNNVLLDLERMIQDADDLQRPQEDQASDEEYHP